MWPFKKHKIEKYPLGLLAPDPTDIRDYQLGEIQPEAVSLPAEFNLRSQMTPVDNQYPFGICYSMATGAVKEFLDTKEADATIKLSKRFIVYNTKQISQIWDIQGDYARNALKAVCDKGVPLESDYPTDTTLDWNKFAKTKPSDEIFEKAKEYAGLTFWRVEKGIDSFRQAVFQQKAPILIGLSWYKSYNTPDTDGKLPLPTDKIGGHFISGSWWTQDEKLWFKNSWGSDWGLQGYFYIPFNEFDKHDIWDAYVLLDLPKKESIIGYIAIQYIQGISYKEGSKAITLQSVNVRDIPSIKGNKLLTLSKDAVISIENSDIIMSDGYKWQKVKI